MTGLEQILSGFLIAGGGGVAVSWFKNRKAVTKEMCQLTHNSLDTLLDEKFENLGKDIIRAVNGNRNKP